MVISTLILLRCSPSGEIIVKSSKEYWIACKKSDLREVYVIVCQKNANLTLIDGNQPIYQIIQIINNIN